MTTGNGHAQHIPVIDLSGFLLEEDLADCLIHAASTSGFFYIRNLGKDIPVEANDSIFGLAKKFFASPLEEKEMVKIKDYSTVKGWTGLNTEALDSKNSRVGDFKEVMNFGEFLDGKAQQPLPLSLVDHEDELAEWGKYCKNLELKLLKLFAIGLKIPAEEGGTNWFSSRHLGGPSGKIWRFCYYPSIPASSDLQTGDLRCGAHSDFGSISLLFQRSGQPGLEILPPSTCVTERTTASTWMPAPVFPPGTENDPSPPILVNIGDLLGYWTNGYFKSVVHRVVFPTDGPAGGEDRYTIAYFGHPVATATLEAVPSQVVSDLQRLNGVGIEKDNVVTAMGYLLNRLNDISLERPKTEDDGSNGEEKAAVVNCITADPVDTLSTALSSAEPVNAVNDLHALKRTSSIEHIERGEPIEPVELLERGDEDENQNNED